VVSGYATERQGNSDGSAEVLNIGSVFSLTYYEMCFWFYGKFGRILILLWIHKMYRKLSYKFYLYYFYGLIFYLYRKIIMKIIHDKIAFCLLSIKKKSHLPFNIEKTCCKWKYNLCHHLYSLDSGRGKGLLLGHLLVWEWFYIFNQWAQSLDKWYLNHSSQNHFKWNIRIYLCTLWLCIWIVSCISRLFLVYTNFPFVLDRIIIHWN
jgi:hypothetical protein